MPGSSKESDREIKDDLVVNPVDPSLKEEPGEGVVLGIDPYDKRLAEKPGDIYRIVDKARLARRTKVNIDELPDPKKYSPK